ncbi:MAG TPA: hypothetical protein VMX17_01935 [Candidatus Glassbacteria bacterium]|nr:hypothetical protein [Candidatus Glassbacteria bacterium]
MKYACNDKKMYSCIVDVTVNFKDHDDEKKSITRTNEFLVHARGMISAKIIIQNLYGKLPPSSIDIISIEDA